MTIKFDEGLICLNFINLHHVNIYEFLFMLMAKFININDAKVATKRN